MTTRIRRAVLAGGLVASALAVGGVGNAWAQTGATESPGASQSDSADAGDSDSSSRADGDCPLEEREADGAADVESSA